MSSSILTSLKPLILISKLIGLALFTINTKSFISTVTKLDLLSINLTIFMHFFLNFIYWRSVFSPEDENFNSEILEVSTPLLIYIDYLINAAAVVWFFIKRKKICQLLKNFNEIDENFIMEFGMKFDYKRQRNKIFAFLIFTITIATLINVNDFITAAGIKINSLEFYNFDIIFFFWNSLCQIIQFCYCIVGMRGIRQRFELLTRCVNDRSRAIKILSKLHLKITTVIGDFNEIFTPVIFMHFADIFCWLCVLIFDIATSALMRNLFTTLAMNIPHSVYMTSFIIVTVKTAESVKSESSKCIARLHEVANDFGGDKSEVFQFALQLVTMKVKFSCGLVDFDWKMLFKFLSAGIMYFIILVQFHKSLSNDGRGDKQVT